MTPATTGEALEPSDSPAEEGDATQLPFPAAGYDDDSPGNIHGALVNGDDDEDRQKGDDGGGGGGGYAKNLRVRGCDGADADDALEKDESDEEDKSNGAGEDMLGGGSVLFRCDEENQDCSHLADRFREPLFVYPSSDPSAKMKAAYEAQRSAKHRYDVLRKSREDFEATAAERLGELHNLLRESREREEKAARALRGRIFHVYEAELQEPAERYEFNGWMRRLRAFVTKCKGLPSPEIIERLENDPDRQEHELLLRWIDDQRAAHERRQLPPHHLASLENLGVSLSLSAEDQWQRSFHKFQLYSKNYWDSPIAVRATHGDVILSIMEYCTGDEIEALQKWCQDQQESYQNGELRGGSYLFAKLVDSGFTFDMNLGDSQWDEHVDLLVQFRNKFGHTYVPKGYHPASFSEGWGDAFRVPKLNEFVGKVRTLIHRDALSPRRMAHLKKVDLYLDLGGRAYGHHTQHCRASRAKRGEEQRRKRKFEVLERLARREEEMARGRKKPVVRRRNMNNWAGKLEKLAAHKDRHGNIDIRNDVKLQAWTFSVIRKLSTNSASLRGQKMKLIEDYEGLMEFLLRKDHVEMAMEDARARKEEVGKWKEEGWIGEEETRKAGEEAKRGKEESKKGVEEVQKVKDASNNNKEEGSRGRRESQGQQDSLEELTEDVLLGKKEDDEVTAFMQSGLQVPGVD